MNPAAVDTTQEVALRIGGMTASCAARIEKRLKKLDPVAQVEAAGYTAEIPASRPSTAADDPAGEDDEVVVVA